MVYLKVHDQYTVELGENKTKPNKKQANKKKKAPQQPRSDFRIPSALVPADDIPRTRIIVTRME